MTHLSRLSVAALALLATVAWLGAGAPPTRAAGAPITVTCTFVNPAYAGSCVESTTRGAKETPAAACQPILECLNNSQCVKTYCRSTSIRQGWTLESAK